MSSRQSLLLAICILVIAGAYFWWRGQAEQQVERQVDLFIETVEYRKLSLTSPESRHTTYNDLFAKVMELNLPSPAPSGKFSRDETIEEIDRFHSYISYFELAESDRKISIDGESATAKITGIFQVASGPNGRYDKSGVMTLSFEKKSDWRITAITLSTD